MTRDLFVIAKFLLKWWLSAIFNFYKSHIRSPSSKSAFVYQFFDENRTIFAAWCYASTVKTPSCGVCVCVSRSCIVSKRINISSTFFTFGWPHHSSFSVLNSMAVFQREPPNGGVKCRWGRLKSRNLWLSGLEINCCCTVVCISHFAAGFWFMAGTGRPSAINGLLCTVRDRPSAVSRCTQSWWTWIVCMTARLDVTPKTESNCTDW